MHKNALIILVSTLIAVILIAGCSSTTSSVNTTLSTPTLVQTTVTVPTTIQIPVTTTMMITTTPTTEIFGQSITNQLATVNSSNPIWLKAYGIFLSINYTEYTHRPYTIDEAAGIYKLDCEGLVDYVLQDSDPAMFQEMAKGANWVLPPMYVKYINSLDIENPNDVGWIKVPHSIDLQPGDVCAFPTPGNGHVFIIAGDPHVNPANNDEILVRIIDVAGDPHSHDSRTPSSLGVGSGVVGFIIDNQGNPIAFNWKGGMTTQTGPFSNQGGPINPLIVCGRWNQ